MPITVEGGQVLLPDQDEKYASPVETIVFNIDQRDPQGQIPLGTGGDMILTRLGQTDRYARYAELNYSDSNNNNDAVLTIVSVVGPLKYNIERTG